MDPEEQEQQELEKAQAERLAREAQGDRPVASPTLPRAPVQPPVVQPETEQGVRRALTATAEDATDIEGTINRLSKLTGAAPATLRALGSEAINQMAKEQGILAATQDAPVLRERFSDPDFTRGANNDVKSLAEIERQMRAYGEAEQARIAAERKPADPAAKAATPDGFGAMYGRIGEGMAEVTPKVPEALASGTARLSSGIYGLARAPFEINDRFASWVAGRPLESDVSKLLAERQEAAKVSADAWMPRVDDPTGQAALSGIASLPSSAAGLVLALMTGGSAAPYVGAGFAGGVTAGDEYGTARAQGMDPLSSATYGLAQGSVETATEMLPMKWLIGDITAQTPFVKMFTRNLVAEGMTEQVATAGQDFLAWAYLPENADKPFSAYLAERPGAAYETLVATFVASSIQTGAIGAITEVQRQTQREEAMAAGGLDALDAMVDAAAESKLRDAVPEQFEAFVEKLAQDAPIRAAYIKPEALAAIAAGEAVSPEELAAEFGVEDQVASSLVTGSPIEIPLGRFLSRVAGKEASRDAYMRSVSWSPFTLTRDELKAIPDGMRDRLQADADKLAASMADDEVFNTGVAEIRTKVQTALDDTGRFVGDPNRTYAQVAAVYYGTLARRLGKTPQQVFEEFPLKVVGESMLAGSQNASDVGLYEQNRTQASERIDKVLNFLDTTEGAASTMPLGEIMRQTGVTSQGVVSRARQMWREEQDALHPMRLREDGKASAAQKRRYRAERREAAAAEIASNDRLLQLDFEPLNTSAAQDLVALPEAEWNDVIKATKYAAYRLPEGVADATLPKGYVVVLTSEAAYAVSEKHLRDRQAAGATVTRVSQTARGEYIPSKAQIGLLRRADLSTFIHELGHHMLEVNVNIAVQLQDRVRGGETLTAGEQELLDDVLGWLQSVNVQPTDAQGNTASLAQDQINWGLDFFEYLRTDPTEADLKQLRIDLAKAGKTPAIRLWKTTNGRIVAFPHDYSHADARMLLREGNKPGAEFKMQHATWEPGFPLKRQNWYDVTGTTDDPGGAFFQSGYPRKAVPATDRDIDRASKEMDEEQFEIYKALVAGKTNQDILAQLNDEIEGDDLLSTRQVTTKVGNTKRTARKLGLAVPEKADRSAGMTLSPETMQVIVLSARGDGPKRIAETVYGTSDKAGQVRVLRNRHANLIEQHKARREGKLFQGPIFYSALKRAVETSKQAQAPADDWKAILKRAEGVKVEEIDAVGLFNYLDMLKDRGQKQIPRADIMAFLENNGVQISEVLLGPPVAVPETAAPVEDAAPATENTDDQGRYDGILDVYENDIRDRLTVKLEEQFNEEKEVFLESNRSARQVYEAEVESQVRALEDSLYEDFYANGNFEPNFYVQEEDDENHDDPDTEPKKVWVVRAHYDPESAPQDRYGTYESEDKAWQAAWDADSENESEAANGYVANSYRETLREAERLAWEDTTVFDEIFELWRNNLDTDAVLEARLEATYEVFNRIGEAPLFDRINPGYGVPAGWANTGPRESFPPTKWDNFTLVKGEKYRELLLTLASHKGTPFTHSTHWPGQQNMLAHVRFSIVDNVVVLDEIQSDWHQKGRDEGYQNPQAIAAHKEAMDVVSALHAPVMAMLQRNDLLGYPYMGDAQAALQNTPPGNWEFNTPEDLAMAEQYHAAVRRRADAAAVLGANTGVPDAPMKDAKSWGGLVLKRMIRWAAEQGHDGIAWTPGDVHAERWNMYNVVDRLILVPTSTQEIHGKEEWTLIARKEGRHVRTADGLSTKEVAEYIGKDLMTQLMASEPQAFESFQDVHTLEIAEGDALVGPGKGQRFFYDVALVQEANRLGKKHDAKVDSKIYPHGHKTRTKGAGGYIPQYINPKTNTNEPATSYHYLPITPKLKAAALEGMPLFQPAEGPKLTPAEERMFSEQMRRKPGDPLINAEERAFFANAMRGLGPDANELDVWNAMSLAQKTPFHEIFARQVEAYFFTGQSPTPKLQGLFSRVMSMMTSVYKSLTELNVELSDEVRQIFDRMFAASQDIAEANKVNAFQPIFAVKPEFMTDTEWGEYQRINAQAVDEAESTLSQRSLRDVKWLGNARSRELKRLQNEAREQRKAMRAQVTSEVMAEPVNVARRFLSRGEQEDGTPVDAELTILGPDGQLVKGKPKLSIAGLEAMYPGGSGVEWKALGFGQWGMLSKDGLHPDVLAPLVGYESGDQLVRELLSAEKAADKIEGITDQRMLERYGDLTDEKAIERAADEAVYSGLRGRVLAAEYAALSNALGERKLINEAAQAAAIRLVGRMPQAKLSPAKFLAAERQAAKRAEQALRKNDLAGAAAAKKDQILSFYVAREVMAKQKERDKASAMFTKILRAKKENVAKSRNFDLVQAARAILVSYGMGQMRNKPVEYLEAIRRYDPQLYASLEPTLNGAMSQGRTLKDLSVDEFMGMRDVVMQLWNLAREEMLVEINGQKVALTDATDALNARMAALGADPNRPVVEAPTPWQRALRMGEALAASLRRVESWARLMDGGKAGAFTRYIFRNVSQAATRYRIDATNYLVRYRDLFNGIEKSLTRDRIHSPELGYTFKGKAELLHAILHTGNESNKRKLLLGYRWATEDANGVLDTSRWDAFTARMAREGVLTAIDYQFAQSVWDLLEETKPLAQEAHRRVFGRYFAEITANEVQTPFGVFRGGYAPALADDHFNADMALKRGQEALEAHDSSMFPSPSKGFTEARVEYNQPLQLDLRLLGSHIDKVLKFAHMAAPTRDVLRILRAKGVERNLHDLHPSAITDMLMPWINRAARQTNEVPISGKAGRAVSTFSNGLRARANMGLMFANLVNVLQQPTGLFNAASFKGFKKRHLAGALVRYLRNPAGTHAAVRQASQLILTRSTQQALAMRDAVNSIVLAKGPLEKATGWFERHTYFAQVALQNQQDVVVWLAAYESAKERGDTEDDAVQFADGVTRETQGSAAPEDISRFETGTGWHKVLVSMYGYFNMWGNQLSTEFRGAMQELGLAKGKGRMVYVYMVGFMAPALLAQFIADALRGDLPDDDEEDHLAWWLAWFFGSQAKTAGAMVPLGGPAIMAGINAFNDKPYDDRVLSSPAISVLETAVRVPMDVFDIATGEGDASRTIKDTLSLLTLMTGLPFQALARPVGYIADVLEGDTEPEDGLDAVRGAIAGR